MEMRPRPARDRDRRLRHGREALGQRCRKYGDRAAHREKKLGVWQEYSWNDYYNGAKRIGLALLKLGVRKGEPVLILAEDRREWLYCDLGAAAVGAIPTGVYTTDSASQLAYVANDSTASVLFVENDEQLDKFLEARDRCPASAM
jgi:long-chain acyl-CoA synthetase